MPVATDPAPKSRALVSGSGAATNMNGVLTAVSRGAATMRRRWSVGEPKRGSAMTMAMRVATEAARGMAT